LKELEDFLIAHKLRRALALPIRALFGADAVKIIKEDPYLLARKVNGVGIKTADRLADELGIPIGSPVRIDGAVWAALEDQQDNGHVFTPRDELLVYGCHAAAPATLHARIDHLLAEGTLIADGAAPLEALNNIYTVGLHEAETIVAERLRALARRNDAPAEVDLRGGERGRYAARFARGTTVEQLPVLPLPSDLTAEQRAAVTATQTDGLTVITGGPGTGKSHTLKAVVELWTALGRRVALAAPTGRAAQRMKEATGHPASTIHKLLEYSGEGFYRDRDNPLDADLIVIDESSMLDITLARHLLDAIDPERSSLLLVGDVDQLPSVGPGQVLYDVIASEIAPVFRLTHVFRQAAGSDIIRAAHEVNSGRAPRRGPVGSDFYVIPPPNTGTLAAGLAARRWILDYCRTQIPRAFGIASRDVQVLAPSYKGEGGILLLNGELREALNPRGRHDAERGYRAGDRVIQTRNNYELGVMNGEVGHVVEVDDDDDLLIEFGGGRIRHKAKFRAQLKLAYALSIHKSQGGQYPAVIVALFGAPSIMLKRNLLYTAITRARKLCIVVGHPSALQYAARTPDTTRRRSGLIKRLRRGS
jgi:exodeoxyribonuclease V alpha subunit